MPAFPIIDIEPLRSADPTDPAFRATAGQIDAACRDSGFFSIVGHGVDGSKVARLQSLAREFFALDEAEKAKIAMAGGGRAWRGWFPVGGELTSGRPDLKEGIYFGAELPTDDPRVVAGLPLHGPNRFPVRPSGLRPAVLDYLEALTRVGQTVLGGVAAGLGLSADWFARGLTADPLILFRIFRYPPADVATGTTDATGATGPTGQWGVGEHTDYGLLTLLCQDESGGLEVRDRDDPTVWIDVPPQPDAFVVNIGDMLDRMTAGRYRSTAHRVRATPADRISMPFFFDPGWSADVRPVPLAEPGPGDDAHLRWDGASVHEWSGTYGEYLLGKVGKVFPDLGGQVLP